MNEYVLIIDDNVDFCKSLSENLDKRNYRSLFATTLDYAKETIKREPIGFILLDLMLTDESGLELLQFLSDWNIDIPVVVLTGYSSVETAVEALKLGAKDYLKKPVDLNSLSKILANHFTKQSRREIPSLPGQSIVTQNKVMLKILTGVEKIARTDMPVLITGENGTGKELIAEFIFARSKRKENQFVRINCAAFAEGLLDNELFGHEKGAYTGADTQFRGVFESANEGTLFLDEIGDMNLSIQAKILRALQNHEIKRIGGSEVLSVDIRFIAATNKNLEKEIQEKRFREDLYFRLNAATIHIPPLRERKDDIPLLTAVFIQEANTTYEKVITGCSDEVWEKLTLYNWPGNIREFKNTLSYSVAMATGTTIQLKDLPKRLFVDVKTVDDLSIQENEKELIIRALKKSYYNKKKAAESLFISRNTLYNKMKKYGIDIS